jgi:hypothetical protein
MENWSSRQRELNYVDFQLTLSSHGTVHELLYTCDTSCSITKVLLIIDLPIILKEKQGRFLELSRQPSKRCHQLHSSRRRREPVNYSLRYANRGGGRNFPFEPHRLQCTLGLRAALFVIRTKMAINYSNRVYAVFIVPLYILLINLCF